MLLVSLATSGYSWLLMVYQQLQLLAAVLHCLNLYVRNSMCGWCSPQRPNPHAGGETCAETCINVFFQKVTFVIENL